MSAQAMIIVGALLIILSCLGLLAWALWDRV